MRPMFAILTAQYHDDCHSIQDSPGESRFFLHSKHVHLLGLSTRYLLKL